MPHETVVIDNGSGVIKAGFAGDDKPQVHLPNIIGIPKHPGSLWDINKSQCHSSKACVMGYDLVTRRGAFKIECPIEDGVVINWNHMTQIFEQLFNVELEIDISKHGILIMEAFMNPRQYREDLAELLFEHFNCPSLFVAYQSLLALYASGHVSGVILDCGESLTTAVSVYDTYAIPTSVVRQNFAGKHITDYLIRLLTETGVRLCSSSEYQLAREIKERCCFVLEDRNSVIQNRSGYLNHKENYKLPDGQVIELSNERFRAPEILFNPLHSGMEYPSLTELVLKSIYNSDVSVRNVLFNHILLTGGSTVFRGLPERLLKELKAQISQPDVDLRIIAPDNRHDQNWIGGSILASLSTFPSICVTKAEFQESGRNIMYRKCP